MCYQNRQAFIVTTSAVHAFQYMTVYCIPSIPCFGAQGVVDSVHRTILVHKQLTALLGALVYGIKSNFSRSVEPFRPARSD